MDLHNLIEDVVLQYLNEILSLKNEDVCKCEQCRLDMACYALNKISPVYVASSRGVVHKESKKRLNFQNDIDIYSIVAEAVNVVSKTKRHVDLDSETQAEEGRDNLDCRLLKGKFFFNFPQIVGKVIDSETLLPVEDCKVILNYDTGDDVVSMFNERWKNPLNLVSQMQGIFSFWVMPIISDGDNIEKKFRFNIKIQKDGFETIRKSFEIKVASSEILNRYISDNNFYIEDIFLYSEGLGDDENLSL